MEGGPHWKKPEHGIAEFSDPGVCQWAWVWPAIQWGLTAFSAHSTRMSGKKQGEALDEAASQKELEARVAKLGVKQTSARRREALLADLGAISARRATQNVAMTGSAAVAERSFEREYLRSLRQETIQGLYDVQGRRTAARGLRMDARSSTMGGIASAIGQIGGGFFSIGGTGASGG